MAETQTAIEIRQLVWIIEKACRESPVNSVCNGIIQSTCSHLRAIARIHGINASTENVD